MQPLTNAELVTSYKIYVTAQDSQKHEMGQIQSINPSQTREVTDSFVLGNDPPDVPKELIPGVSKNRRLQVSNIALYARDFNKTIARDDQDIVSSLSDQNTPFDVHEVITNPNDGTSKTRIYQGCYLSDISKVTDITRGDIRIIESATIAFKTVTETKFQ